MSVIGDILVTVNSDINKTLDELITEKTNIKIQTKTFNMNPGSLTVDAIIDTIDISKTIIIPVSYVNDANTVSISVNFINSSQIRATRTGPRDGIPGAINYTVLVITFGANVNNS